MGKSTIQPGIGRLAAHSRIGARFFRRTRFIMAPSSIARTPTRSASTSGSIGACCEREGGPAPSLASLTRLTNLPIRICRQRLPLRPSGSRQSRRRRPHSCLRLRRFDWARRSSSIASANGVKWETPPLERAKGIEPLYAAWEDHLAAGAIALSCSQRITPARFLNNFLSKGLNPRPTGQLADGRRSISELTPAQHCQHG